MPGDHDARRKRYIRGARRRRRGKWRARHAELIQRIVYAAVSLALVVVSIQLVYALAVRFLAPEPEVVVVAEPPTPVDVRIEGAVERPGVYPVLPGTVLSEVLAQSGVRRSADLSGIDVDQSVIGALSLVIPFVAAQVDTGPYAGIGLTATEYKRGAIEEAQMQAELEAIKERVPDVSAPSVDLRNLDFLVIGPPIVYVVVSLDAKHRAIQLTQIPAEAQVSTPTASNNGWLREAYLLGGPASVVDHVSRITGFALDHYVVQDPETLVQAIDLMGGVDVVLTPAEAAHLRVKTGKQRLDGEQSWRHLTGYRPTADALSLTREQNNRMMKWMTFMRSLFSGFRSQNWWTTVRVSRAVALGSETSFTLADVLGLAKLLQDTQDWTIATQTAPGQWRTGEAGVHWEPSVPGHSGDVAGSFSSRSGERQ